MFIIQNLNYFEEINLKPILWGRWDIGTAHVEKCTRRVAQSKLNFLFIYDNIL